MSPSAVAMIQSRAAAPRRPQAPGLDGAEDDAGDGAAEQGGGEPVDRARDQVGGVAAEREAQEGRQPASGGPLPRGVGWAVVSLRAGLMVCATDLHDRLLDGGAVVG